MSLTSPVRRGWRPTDKNVTKKKKIRPVKTLFYFLLFFFLFAPRLPIMYGRVYLGRRKQCVNINGNNRKLIFFFFIRLYTYNTCRRYTQRSGFLRSDGLYGRLFSWNELHPRPLPPRKTTTVSCVRGAIPRRIVFFFSLIIFRMDYTHEFRRFRHR